MTPRSLLAGMALLASRLIYGDKISLELSALERR